MSRAPDDSGTAARPRWATMNTNDLMAAGTVHGAHLGLGPIVLALLVLGGLAYGVTRRTQRQRPGTRPDPPFPRPDPPSPQPDR